MLTRSQSSWTATLLAPQSRGRARRDLWLRLVTTLKFGSTLQSLTALRVGEAEFYTVVKGGQSGLSLRSMYQDLGIPMKIEIQSDSSTANSLTDRLKAGQRTLHTDTQVLLETRTSPQTETSASRRCLQRRTAQMLERRQSLLQCYNNIASLHDWYSTDHGSHTPLQDEGDEACDVSGEGLQTPKSSWQAVGEPNAPTWKLRVLRPSAQSLP